MTGKVLESNRDYSDDRSVREQVNGSLSTRMTTLSGAPQVAILGPILFLVYINDLPEFAPRNIKLFDDKKIWTCEARQ